MRSDTPDRHPFTHRYPGHWRQPTNSGRSANSVSLAGSVIRKVNGEVLTFLKSGRGNTPGEVMYQAIDASGRPVRIFGYVVDLTEEVIGAAIGVVRDNRHIGKVLVKHEFVQNANKAALGDVLLVFDINYAADVDLPVGRYALRLDAGNGPARPARPKPRIRGRFLVKKRTDLMIVTTDNGNTFKAKLRDVPGDVAFVPGTRITFVPFTDPVHGYVARDIRRA